MTTSICTIARGRESHLRHLITGMTRQTVAPTELVIAHMQPDPFAELPDTDFPVRQVQVDGSRPRLAAARNAAASTAKGKALIFLDVDCIPLPGLVEAYLDAMAVDRCLMGETRYLAEDHRPGTMTSEFLWEVSEQHPARRFEDVLGRGIRRIPMATEFWSLSFALSAETLWRLGGFDEIFEGYGGEDTDFAMRLGQSDTSLYWVPEARAVHQWHSVEKPPLTHLEDIVRNANLFRQKHGSWCMEYWLNQLVEGGFIDWGDDLIEIVRYPSADEREAARGGGSVRFS